MARKPRRNVPESLRSLFGEKARNLKDAIVDLITRQSIQPEQCRCKGQGCLGCSRDKPSFLLRPDDPNHYRQLLLHRCFVVLHEQAPPLPRFSPTSWWSQREIVEKVIETGGDSGKNVICARYDKYEQTSPVLELLITSSWEFLLNRIGHDLMVYLLRHTSIFLPFQGKNHQQVSGPPLRITQNETLPVHNNKRKSDESVNPSKKRQRVSSTVSDCPKDKSAAVTSKASVDVVDEHREEKPKKRFRLYLKRRQKQRRDNCPNVDDEATCETSCTNGEASTGNEADGRNQKISTSGSLTDFTKQAKQVKGNKHFKFSNSEYVSVIPPNHILKTLKANYSDSKSLMNHIFGEVSAWSAAPSHGKGNCPSGSICLYHSLLNSLKSLIGKTKSSYLKTLLDKHCPVLLPQESASANAASQSSWRQNSDKLPRGSCSEKGKPNGHNVGEARLYCRKDQVVSFIWAICSHIIPEGLLGTKHQMRVLLSNMAWLVSRRRNEKCTVTQFLHKVKPSGFPFSAKKQLCCMVSGHALQNESISSTQQMLCTKWISWLFLEIVKKVGLFNFYATERQDGRQNIYYYRKCNWEKLVRKEISKTLNGYVQVDNAEAESRREKFELSKYRFLPKGNGARMLLDFSSSSRSPSLRDVHSVLKDIQLKEPDVLGSSVFDHDDFYRNLGPYLKDLRSQSGELPPLFLVVADVRKAFDSIDQGKLLDIVQCVLKDEHILKKCRLVCRGKRSRWVNNILVSTDKNDTVARFTSTFPYNGLQSIIVDQGQNHLVRKNDVMHWINDMLKNNMVQIDKNFYVQIAGIPQGHKLSSLLCSFYYGHLERTFMYPFLDQAFGDASAEACNGEKELITSPSYKLLRFIDDYLFVSTSREQATRFYQRLKQGFPDYNCSMNYKKFCINFEDGVESQNSSNTKRMYVGGNGVSFIRWTGLLINSRTFEVQADYTRYASGHISSTFTVAWQNQPVGNLRHKLCYFLVPKCHPILFDSNINSGATVRLNIYQTFLLAAMKCHCYLYELARFWKVPPQNLSKFITRSIRYMFKLIQRKTHRINTGSSFRPVLKLRKEEVMWLGLHAYVQVLKRKHSRYRTLLNYLGSALLKLDLPLDLSPDLEYATNRSNSSILWDLSY